MLARDGRDLEATMIELDDTNASEIAAEFVRARRRAPAARRWAWS